MILNNKKFICIFMVAAIAAAVQGCGRDETHDRSGETSVSTLQKPNAADIIEITLVELEKDTEPVKESRTFPLIRNKDFTTSTGKRVNLNLLDDSEIMSIQPDAAESRFIVEQGSPRAFSVYGDDGELIAKLPMVNQVLPDLEPRTQFIWQWVNGDQLIATLGFIHEVLQNQYPERDSEAYDILFYYYNLESGSLVELKVSSVESKDGLLRLDGLTTEGHLMFSIVPFNADYWDKDIGESLGVFEIPES